MEISEPFFVEDKWDHEGYHRSEYGSVHYVKEMKEDFPDHDDMAQLKFILKDNTQEIVIDSTPD